MFHESRSDSSAEEVGIDEKTADKTSQKPDESDGPAMVDGNPGFGLGKVDGADNLSLTKKILFAEKRMSVP